MQVYIDLENLLKEKNISKTKSGKRVNYSGHSLITIARTKFPELTSQSLQSSVIFWNVLQTTS